MKKRRWVVAGLLILGCVGFTSCVFPFYGTARIEKGLKIDAGLSGSKTILPVFDHWGFFDTYSIQGDVNFRYGFNDYLGINARSSIGYLMLNAGLGIQAAYPTGLVTPALHADVSLSGIGPFSVAFLLGIGKKEWATLGIRTHIPGNLGDDPHPEYGPYLDPYPIDVFAGIHIGRINLFAGSQMFRYTYNDEPLFAVGIGYTFGPIVRRAKL